MKRATPRRDDRQSAERLGRRGERWAAWWLRLSGWRILAHRVRTPVGEIDLVVRRGGILCFVEVKTRRQISDEALDPRRYRRVEAAARWLMPRYFSPSIHSYRIDLILITPWRLPKRLANLIVDQGQIR